ncbi:MAG: M56 family metallopeptidase [Ferruginibacter sp.]
MPLTVFDNAYFLASLGWAVGNSLWQAGLLWLIYKLFTVSNKQPALFKYNLSTLLLFLSFSWFTITLIQNYFLLKDTAYTTISFFGTGKLFMMQKFMSVLPWMALLYILLLLVYVYRFIKQYRATRFIKTTGLHKAGADIRLFVKNTALHLGIKKNVAVWISANVDVPSVIGAFKPVILLPAAVINNLTTGQVETVLLHELAHIKRNDFLINFFQSAVEVILFFNPFIIKLSRSAREEREHCCDDWVLNYQYNKHDYASALLVIEQQRQQQQPAFAMAATNGKKDLLNRVKRLFNTTPETSIRFSQKIRLTGLSLTLITFILAVLPLLNTFNKPGEPVVVNNDEPVAAKFASFNESKNTYTEQQAETIINDKPVADNLPVIHKRSLKQTVKASRDTKPAEVNAEEEYALALINEELLKKNAELADIAMQAAEKAVETQKIYVKVEEEVSGKKQKKTYYFELNNNEGTPEVKPLAVLNKFSKAKTETSTKKVKKNINTKKEPRKRTTA